MDSLAVQPNVARETNLYMILPLRKGSDHSQDEAGRGSAHATS
jgi:hypothetical protein